VPSTNSNPALFESRLNKTILILESYFRTFRKIVWRTGLLIALLGAFIAGLGNDMTKAIGYDGDTIYTVGGGQFFLVTGIFITITGLLIMFLPTIRQKDIRR
jgi:hypothetical protein